VACAVAALEALQDRYPISDVQLARGMRRVRWPGRLELLEGVPRVLCDAAHNPHACEALADHLAHIGGDYSRLVLLFGCMRDKDHRRMMAIMRPHFAALVFTTSGTSRSLPAEWLAKRYRGDAVEDPETALELARKRAGKRGLVVACGSIFVMAAVRAAVLGVRSDPPIAL
jgi:folylpolyglutamate synthase/dihydropteroate synthase